MVYTKLQIFNNFIVHKFISVKGKTGDKRHNFFNALKILKTPLASGVIVDYCRKRCAVAADGDIVVWIFSENFVYGADISFWNVSVSSGNDYSRVDFAKMKASGCDYVILRIGYEARATRQNVIDSAFIEYYKRGRAAGMPTLKIFQSTSQ